MWVYQFNGCADGLWWDAISASLLTFAFQFLLLLAQFIPIDLEKSITDGVPDGEYNAKKADVDQQVTEAL